MLDILPGIYDPSSYLRRLAEFKRNAWIARQHGRPLSVIRREIHRRAVVDLRAGGFGPGMDLFSAVNVSAGTSITGAERGLKRAVGLRKGRSGLGLGRTRNDTDRQPANRRLTAPFDATDKLANWKALTEDTRINESVRRR